MRYPIFDCHTHIYPAKIAAAATKSICDFYHTTASLDGTVEGLLRQADAAGISRCLALAVAVDARHVSRVNDILIAAVSARRDRLWGFASLHPDLEDPEKEVDRVLRAGMKGIKLHPDMQHFSLSEARADRLFAACAGICPVLIHTGDRRYHNSNPALIPPILRKYPSLTLICAHFGGYSEWDPAVEQLADTNVFVDTSSSARFLPPERIRALIDAYGEDRVLFGTDYPMWTAQPEIDLLLSLGLSDTALRKIFSENLARLLGEPLPPTPA